MHASLTLGGMSCTSGIQSPFHRTPRRPRGGIRPHSVRVYTLPGRGGGGGGGGCVLDISMSRSHDTWCCNASRRLTDAAVRHHPVPVVTLLPRGDLHDPVAAVTVVVGSVFHGLEWHQLERQRLLQNFEKGVGGASGEG